MLLHGCHTKIHLWLCGSAKCFPPAGCCEHWLAFHVMSFFTQHFITSIKGLFCDLKMKPKWQSVLHMCNFPKARQTFSKENVSRTSELLNDFSWHCRPRVLFSLPIWGGFLTKQFKRQQFEFASKTITFSKQQDRYARVISRLSVHT